MNGKTYYMILGVSRAESPAGIRAAYRDLARKLHPDVAGQQATHAFQELSEAYDVLSDPQRRREYECGLRRAESSHVAPIRPAPAAPLARAPVSLFGAAESGRPSFEAMFDWFLRNFTGVGVPKSERLEGLNIEVVLTNEEARQGCVLPVGVPAFRCCPYCGGSGRDLVFPCLSCQQRGMIEDEEIVRIPIPAMARSGSIYEMPLQGLGIHNFYLRLHVFVEPQTTDDGITTMWWECSECGGQVDRPSAPVVCPECGIAGVILMPADPDDLTSGDSDGDGLRAMWLRVGVEQPELVAPT